MNTVKNYITIYIQLISIDVSEDLILLMTYLIKHVFQKKRRFKSKSVQHDCRNKWIKTLTKHISLERKGKFDGKNVIQIKSGTMINVAVSET